MLPHDKAPQLTPKQRKILHEQTISEDGPGTIGRDFESLLRFVAERDVPVSGVHQLLSMKLLPQLNERMARPLDIRLQRPQLKSFPHLNGLYLLLRASGLSRLENVGKQHLLRLDEEALRVWQGLNPTERYFSLLETWLLRAGEEIIGERYAPFLPLDKVAHFARRIPAGGMAVAGTRDEEGIRYYPGLHNLALLEEFGLLDIKQGKPRPSEGTKPGGGWHVERVALTPFGDAVFALLAQADPRLGTMRLKDDTASSALDLFAALFTGQPSALAAAEEVNDEEDHEFEEPLLGQWQPLFQPFFPEWRQNFTLPEPATTEGVYVFNVSLGRVWRRLAIPSHLMLEDLSNAILQAFEFDNDHLHQFSYRNRFGTTIEVRHPFMEEPPSTDRVAVGKLPLRPGDRMIYLFDFGDHWEFDVTLERIEPPARRMKKARLLETHGKAPEQYPDWDEMD